MSDEIRVLEGPEYQEDVDRAKKDPQIKSMARGLKQAIEDGHVDPNENLTMQSYHEALRREVEFRFIGTPWRAIKELLDGS